MTTEKVKETQKAYYNKIKDNHDYKERRNAYNKEYFKTKYEDAEWKQKRLNYYRKYGKEWRLNKKNKELQIKIERFKNKLLEN
jgi:hypothetical protein